MPIPKVFDLTADLETFMPSWPSAPLPLFEPIATVGRDGYAMERLTCLSHCGTHVDAPSHFIEGGVTVDQIPPERFVGSLRVLDLRADLTGPFITPEILEPHWRSSDVPEFLFLETGWSRRRAFTRDYLYDFPGLTPAAARWVVERGARAVGIDTMSIDVAEATDFPSHRVLLGHSVLNIENLDHLEQLEEGTTYQVVAAPLKIRGGSGGMCRVLAIPR